MKMLKIGLIATACAVAAPASAQVLDLSTIKCKEFFEGSKENIGYTLAWLNAYYKDEDDPPVIDFDKMKKDAERLGAYCASNPTVGLITAADALFDK